MPLPTPSERELPSPLKLKRRQQMGCDAYADELGELKILISRYEDGKVLKIVQIEGLRPKEKISVEYLKGDKR
jgi:hypothetical protein